MEILNYTGQSLGMTNENGKPGRVLPSVGNARFENVAHEKISTIDGLEIFETVYGRIVDLPKPDPNLEQLYIVNYDIAVRAKSSRFDLLVAIEPIIYNATTFFQKLVNIV
jgi:hypothetical protein